ncbi:MAG: hypothetical protein KAV87_28145 [Desulfobacteraceae bacterium]|nr:hypothetical protein [Desulfobacteraceae bacterium]
MLRKYLDPRMFPMQGGCNTYLDKTQLKLGQFSFMQNVRNDHPGLRSRKGQNKLYTTADQSNQVVNMYQYRSIRGGEQIVFAQMSDGDLIEQSVANVKIPDQYAGAFGALSHNGSANQIPASFSTTKDHMLYSNGADQHQIYAGSGSLVDKFVVFDGVDAPADIPDNGRDYSNEVRDLADTNKVAILDNLNTYAAFECIFINTKVPCNSLTFDVPAINGTGSVASLYYWNGTAWTAVSGFSDGTASAGSTFRQDGAMTWTSPGSSEQEKFMYGVNGFWYQIRVSVQLDAEVEVASVLFDDLRPQSLRNIWDGLSIFGVEAQFYYDTDSTYSVYGAAAVDIGGMVAADAFYMAAADKIEGIYIDPGSTPNNGITPTINIAYWNGTAWVSHTTETDGTNGMANAGWITFARKTDEYPREFQTSQYRAYWYKITVDQTLSSTMTVSLSYMPYFDVTEFGSIGQSNAVWKDRACYSFTLFGPYIYVSKTGKPMVLNGTDYGILKAGDGRYNKIVAMRKFVNELMVWQEEIGEPGGCVTIFEGYSPTNFGKLVLSAKIGAMNAKSVAVIDGVMTSTATDERLKTLAIFLSRYGVCATDGRTISVISDDIRDYFDPQQDNSIRQGYEDQMWLNFDSADNVVRVGLVTSVPRSTGTTTSTTAGRLEDTEAAFTTDGTAAGDTVYNTTDDTTALITAVIDADTISLDPDIMVSGEGYKILASTPNTFPVLDMTNKTWSFDELGQKLSCLTEVSPDSGSTEQLQTVQLGGGVADGLIYRLNKGEDDVSTAIDSYIDQEVNADGEYFILDELAARVKTKSAGNLTVSFYKNGVLQGNTKTLSMVAVTAGEINRRHRFYLNLQDDHITVRYQNNTISQSFSLHDIGYGVKVWDGM